VRSDVTSCRAYWTPKHPLTVAQRWPNLHDNLFPFNTDLLDEHSLQCVHQSRAQLMSIIHLAAYSNTCAFAC
jgi:hypothetical protein